MKRTRIFSIILLLAVCMSCSDDSSYYFPGGVSTEENGGGSSGGYGGGGGGGGQTPTGISESEVRSCVSTSLYYYFDRLYYEMTVTSTLESKYPGKDIVYGVEYGYDNTYCYYKTQKKQSGSMTFLIPLVNIHPKMGVEWDQPGWTFNVWNWVGQTSVPGTWPTSSYTASEYSTLITYGHAVYTMVQKRYEQGQTWTASEKDLYRSGMAGMKYETNKLKNLLCMRCFVMIDGQKYNI